MLLGVWVRFQVWLRNQKGQALSEYGIIIAIVILGLIATMGAFRDELAGVFERIGDVFNEQARQE